jgi:putative DNA primase/helicase
LEVIMQVSQEFDESTGAGLDSAEGAARRAPDGRFVPSSPCGDKPDLIIDPADLPAAAYGLRDLLARSGDFFERGVPVKVVPGTDGGPPTAVSLTVNDVLFEAHRLSRPVKLVGDELVPVTLLDRLARMYLEMRGKWNLRPLAGVSTAPLLSADGSIRIAEGYDRDTRLYCANVPDLVAPVIENDGNF